MLTYFLNVLFWFVCLSCSYLLDHYFFGVQWSPPSAGSFTVIFLLSAAAPAFVKFVMRWELFGLEKIGTLTKREYIKLLKAALIANGITFAIAHYVSPGYFAMYCFAGMTLCAFQVGFGTIQSKRLVQVQQ